MFTIYVGIDLFYVNFVQNFNEVPVFQTGLKWGYCVCMSWVLRVSVLPTEYVTSLSYETLVPILATSGAANGGRWFGQTG